MSLKPIFLFSLPRSGSTLLQRILAAHPSVSTTSEPWILLPAVYSFRGDGVVGEYSHTTAAKAIQGFASSLPHGWDTYLQSIRSFANELYIAASEDESLYFLDKTPRYYLIINEIVRIFPEGKFIFLFRNPLQVLSSMINTWHSGRLRLHGNLVDLMRGPFLLTEGWEKFGLRSHRILFEELIGDTENTISKMFEYLELDVQPGFLLEDIAPLGGSMGDKAGQKQYEGVDFAVLQKWKQTLGSRYRKRFALRYLNKLGPKVLKTFGQEFDDLCEQTNSLPCSFGGEVQDRVDQLVSRIIMLVELSLLKMKCRSFRKGETMVLHN